jgi:hypothetical protein
MPKPTKASRSAAARKGAETKRKNAAAAVEKLRKPTAAQTRIVRDLHLVSPFLRGADIAQLQRACNAVSDEKKLRRTLAVDGEYGPNTRDVAKLVAYSLGLRHKHLRPMVHGRIDKATQAVIRNPKLRSQAATSRAKRRIKGIRRHQRSNDNVRAKIVANAQWGIANNAAIHYQQSRPIEGLNTPRKLPLFTDCSGFATDCAKWAGARDPNQNGYNGQGYTGTFLTGCRHIAREAARPGDYVVFGLYAGTHVVILLEPGTVPDPHCASHGQESGPSYYPLSVEASAHAGQPLTFLSAT